MFLKATSGKISGCDVVRCPSGPQDSLECEVGSSTLKAFGIANFTTNINPQPLTWTLGLQENYDSENRIQLIFDRNYYLGTPPSLRLANATGRALFFEGIATSLTATDAKDAMNSFNCSDVLSQSCVSDLTAQARTTAEDLLGQATERNSLDFCNRLGSSLQSHPPGYCASVRYDWSKVAARPLTGFSATPPIDLHQCHPTTSDNYSLSLVFSERYGLASREWAQLKPVLEGITPVMTVLNRGSGSEAELTCLQLVEDQANSNHDQQPEESGAGEKPFTGWKFVAVALAGLFLL